jgi:small conductance mechanosensitive channel
MRRRALELLLVTAASVVAAIFAKYLSSEGVIPTGYALPTYALILLIGGYLGIRVINKALQMVVEPTLGVTRTEGIKNTFELVAGIILIIATFALFGFNLTAALISAGFLGIVLGLAAQQVLGNIFAGLSMLVSKPFEIGDRVTIATSNYGLTGSTYSHESQVSGFNGVVRDVGIFFTRVVLDDGTPATFPNSVVIGALVVNHSRAVGRSVKVRFDLDRRVDFDKFRATFLEQLSLQPKLSGAKSSVEVADLGASTYQVLATVWAEGDVEPVRTSVIEGAMKAQAELSPT